METYRLFIAAELPPQIKRSLAALQQRLRQGAAPVKWVAPESMHLTLRFLGDTPVAALPQLGAALRAGLAGRAAIELRLGEAGAFPSLRRPSVVWAGVAGDVASLQAAYAALSASLAPLGFPPEGRAFQPHLTLGRVRREATPAEQERLGAAIRAHGPPEPEPWRVEHIALFRSELRPSGPIYTTIEMADLFI